MAIKIPPGEKVIRDNRLTLIRVLLTLADEDRLKVMKDVVKETMTAKGARFATSDFVTARLQGGGSPKWIDPAKLHALVKSGEITFPQFLACISVKKEPLKKILSGGQIDSISAAARVESDHQSLFTEFNQGVEVDLDRIEDAILEALAQC